MLDQVTKFSSEIVIIPPAAICPRGGCFNMQSINEKVFHLQVLLSLKS